MRVSTQFPIAVHVLMMIAYFPQVRVTSDIVAQSAGYNAVIIRNIFVKLKKAGLLNISTGTVGTSLAKAPEEISLWDVYVAVESDKTDDLFKMHSNMSKVCPLGSKLRNLLICHLDSAVNAIKSQLSCVSLAKMTEEIRSMNKD